MRNNVPGIHIPDAVIDRLERAAKPAEEGKKLCIELIEEARQITGVAGVHIMAYRREHLVHEIIEETGLLKERLEAKARDQQATDQQATDQQATDQQATDQQASGNGNAKGDG
jgi:hypothetical protein